jgi:molybdopterin synthase catalytic subunit
MSTPPSGDLILLVRNVIDADALMYHVRTAADGSIVTFDGCVRNQSHGRPTLYLDYEAYESMALAKMREIAAEAHAQFPIDRVAIAHRLGRLEIGESRVRCLPLRHRHPQALGSHLEKGILRRRRRLG